ncbi:MAG TPA: xanthine dehydrogenase family protein molybdopterin-binding subunit [Anaerovoracaceae bacterium]|nr:xanthine dehydrogenase family protein molybdopterin-binding subunit [Anaerovoracaceae bacterium]
MDDYRYVGKNIERKDALEKVTGTAVFGADINLPRQLYAAICRSPWAHAKIVSIDISEVENLPGVKVVLTGKDNLGNFGQFITDQPVIAGDKVRYEGEPVAAVAAEDLDTAMEAVRRIKVVYEPLEAVLNPMDAIRQDAVLVHEDWNAYEMAHEACPTLGTNICDSFRLRRGDVEKGFQEADIILEKFYNTKGIQHSTIETHCATAQYDERGLVVWTPAQSPFMLRGQLAKLFKLSINKVRLICTYVGGGFGSKYELRAEPLAAALAMRTEGRPVKLVFTRHEEYVSSGVRGPSYVHLKTGVKKDGTFTAYEIKVYYDTGAYTTTGPRVTYNSGLAAGSPYKIPNVSVDAYTIVTNKQSTCAYRGFGVPEISWAYESQMDLLAQELNMDPLELRLMNAYEDGDLSDTGEKLFSVGLKECLREAARLIGWDKNFKGELTPDGKLRGKGIACTNKLTGTPSTSSVMIKMNEDGSVTILKSGMEIGQGVDTAIPVMVAEALGISIDKVMVVPVDTMYTPFEKTTTGSRLTFHVGNAALRAVEDMKEQIRHLASIAWKTDQDLITIENGLITGRDQEGNVRTLALEEIGKSGLMKEQEPILGRGLYTTSDIFDPPDKETHQSTRPTVMWFWSAQAVDLTVDPETGKVEILKFAAAHDVGKAINQMGVIQQIEGSVSMGLGHTLLEEMIYDENSILQNPNMVDFKVPTMRDSNYDLGIAIVENPHPEGPFGAKGIGEPALTPTAPAVGNAIAQAAGIRLYSIPLKADDILLALKQKQNEGR